MFRDQEIIDVISCLESRIDSMHDNNSKVYKELERVLNDFMTILHQINSNAKTIATFSRDDLELKKIVKDAMHEYHEDMIKAEVKKAKKK